MRAQEKTEETQKEPNLLEKLYQAREKAEKNCKELKACKDNNSEIAYTDNGMQILRKTRAFMKSNC